MPTEANAPFGKCALCPHLVGKESTFKKSITKVNKPKENNDEKKKNSIQAVVVLKKHDDLCRVEAQ